MRYWMVGCLTTHKNICSPSGDELQLCEPIAFVLNNTRHLLMDANMAASDHVKATYPLIEGCAECRVAQPLWEVRVLARAQASSMRFTLWNAQHMRTGPER